MDRQPPRATSDEIDLYIRTYYSLLRSSGEVRVRSFEESHSFSNSSLHAGAQDPDPDVAAFAYSAARLPACMHRVRLLVLGQSHEHFEAAGLEVRGWRKVGTRGRRRPLRWDEGGVLAAFIASTSDIDDLVPIVTAYQIEWNKMHERLAGRDPGTLLAAPDDAALAEALGLPAAGAATLRAALGESFGEALYALCAGPLDLGMRLLNGSYAQYQRAAQRWWSGIEPHYLRPGQRPRRPPVYFVSSNGHVLSNLLCGYARLHRAPILEFARRKDPEALARPLEEALASGDEGAAGNLLYYLLRACLHDASSGPGAAGLRAEVQRFDAEGGLTSIETPGHIDVNAQLIAIARLRPERLDPQLGLSADEAEALRESDAVILNIDYPLGMAAYHHLSRVVQGVGELRGLYFMGKAATLNGRVGDVMVSTVVHDEHTQNTYLFRNCFTARAIAPLLQRGTVLDNQKALTVRGPFLQNRQYMSVFYHEGYTVLEMEAGPYLSAIYEIVSPNRHPTGEIIHLSNLTPFEVGLLHYASDTPYSRRQSLLSKSLSYFGVDSTYGCARAICARILRAEVARLRG